MARFRLELGLACWLCMAAIGSAETPPASDWSEDDVIWTTQSYWQGDSILQTYTFTSNKDDRVTGESSVQVHMQVGEERPRDGVELRLPFSKPLDLSGAEAVELWLKVVDGSGLKLRNAYFCSPGFKKLTIADPFNDRETMNCQAASRVPTAQAMR